MQPFYMLAGVDLRLADDDSDTRALTLTKLALPPLKLAKATHDPAGGVGAVGFVMPRLEELSPKAEIAGLDERFISLIGIKQDYEFAKSWQDKETGEYFAARGEISGVLLSWEPDEAGGGAELHKCNHEWAEVTRYSYYINERRIFDYNFFAKEAWFGDNDLLADFRRSLGLGGTRG
ncbi:phage major tail tube protein [Roseibium sediminis]|uniref:phage major tail tube protein n=1 Tax=Roseibium sediminis TaxID=1775174 RepID=UPI00123DC115|nr:phage major tail tube protein [Roseibium sediminis]